MRNGEGFLNLSGLGTTSFQVTPHPGRSVTLYVASQTYHGMTIQPLRLDIGPSGTPFDLAGSSKRLTMRISGCNCSARIAV